MYIGIHIYLDLTYTIATLAADKSIWRSTHEGMFRATEHSTLHDWCFPSMYSAHNFLVFTSPLGRCCAKARQFRVADCHNEAQLLHTATEIIQFFLAGCQWAYIGDWATIFSRTCKSGLLLETGLH